MRNEKEIKKYCKYLKHRLRACVKENMYYTAGYYDNLLEALEWVLEK